MTGTESAQALLRFYRWGGLLELCAPIESSSLDGGRVLREMCEAALEGDPLHLRALFILGDEYTRSGEWEKGLRIDLKLFALRPDDPLVLYNLACSYSLVGSKGLAFAALERAVTLGYDDVEQMLRDTDLENIRSDARFERLARRAAQIRDALA